MWSPTFFSVLNCPFLCVLLYLRFNFRFVEIQEVVSVSNLPSSSLGICLLPGRMESPGHLLTSQLLLIVKLIKIVAHSCHVHYSASILPQLI
jgi:hypothetical protein